MSAGTHRIVRFVRYLPQFGWVPYVLSEGTVDGLDSEIANELELPSDLVVRRSQRWGRSPRQSNGPAQESGVAKSRSSSHVHAPRLQPLRLFAKNTRDLFLATPDKNVAWCLPTLRKAMTMVRQHQPDAILTSGPPHSTHMIGLALKRLTGTAWVADFRDPWARRPWGPKSENPWGQRLLGRIERRCVQQADRIILNTLRMRDDFRAHYGDLRPEQFVAIPNGCDPHLASEIGAFCLEQSGHSQRTLPRKFVLCHPGSLYRMRDPRPLVKAIAALRSEGVGVELEQIGTCDPNFELATCIAEHDLTEQIRLHPPVPHRECLHQMAFADAFVLLQPGTSTQVPGKVFEMICFGKPILALTDEGETADLVRRYGLGVVADASSERSIVTAVREVMSQQAVFSDRSRWERVRLDYDGVSLTRHLAETLAEVACVEQCLPVPPAERTEHPVNENPSADNGQTTMVSSR